MPNNDIKFYNRLEYSFLSGIKHTLTKSYGLKVKEVNMHISLK